MIPSLLYDSWSRVGSLTSRLLLAGLCLISSSEWGLKAEASPATSQRSSDQAPAQQAPILGVVKSAENLSDWQSITTRLDATGLTYQVINWGDVQRSTDFGNITVLFLPNIETITSEQLLGVQGWLNQGGRIIVSGAIGSQSSSGVQNALRSLLGAYWASDLSQSQTLQPLQIASQRWVGTANTESPVIGGVIVPTSLASQPVAVWNQSGRSTSTRTTGDTAAIVITSRSTFLGWHWGDSEASLAEFDSSWLRAAADRFEGISPMPAPSTRIAPQTTATATTAPAQTSRLSNLQPEISRVRRVPDASNHRLDVARLLHPNQPPEQPSESRSASTTHSQDPAEQVAPSELPMNRGTRITLYEATNMRQELESLIGRYESALILAQARTHAPLTRAAHSAPKTAVSSQEASAQATSSTESGAIDDTILSQARQGYAAFSQAMRQQDYAAARQQWLATRQLLQNNFPLDQPLAQPEVRAIWLDRGTIVQAGSRQGLAQIFDRLAAAGINTVFFETVNAGYPIYPSQVAPAQNPLTRNWDPLAEAVDLAHARGMELHAWVWTFAAGNQRHNAILNQPSSYPGPVLSAHPDWANYDNRGSMIPPGQTKPFLDPANPEVRRYLLNLFEEIVSRYDVDGLQLDYIRYPFQDPRAGGHTYGYGMAARQQFQQLTGIDPITLSPIGSQSQLWQQWTEFRAEQINTFVAETSKLVHQLNPNLVLSTAVFALPERRRINEIQQNWEIWAQRGDVDMVVLMSYASDTNGLQRLASPWLSGNVDLGSTLIVPGIRLLNLSDQTIVDQIQSLRDSASGGFALFAAENLNSRLQDIFNHTQGEASTTSVDPIPYRQPFDTALSRYDVLLQQWNWLLETGQLQMSDQQLETWHSKTTALQQILQALASDPSAQTLQQARTLLHSFQSQSKTWMNLPELSEDYRVSTWQNQLTVLETLLSYGERVVLTRQNSPVQRAGTD